MFIYAQLREAYDLTSAAWKRNMAEWNILLARNASTGLLTPWAACHNRSERYLGGPEARFQGGTMATDKTLEVRAAKRSMLTAMIVTAAAQKRPSTFGRRAAAHRMFYCDVDGALFPNEVCEGCCCYCSNVLVERTS